MTTYIPAIRYTYEFVTYVPDRMLVVRLFPMETTYEWSDTGLGSTRIMLRNKDVFEIRPARRGGGRRDGFGRPGRIWTLNGILEQDAG